MSLNGEELLDWYDRQPKSRSLSELAAELGIEYKTLETRLYRARAARKAREGWRHPAKPELFKVDLGEPWTLAGDWVITGDVHVPFTDFEFAQMVALVGKKHLRKPRRLLVAGDFYNFDLFSAYAHLVEPPSWKQEKQAARHLVDVWLETFAEIRFLMGNHDRRITKSTGFMDDDDLSDLLGRPERCQWSKYGWCVIQADTGPWRVTHPKNYSVNAGIVANELANKYQMNVIAFHEHHSNVGRSRFGRYTIINAGTLADPGKFAYVALDDNKSAEMKQSFVLLKGGFAHLLDKQMTDWKEWI